MTTANTPPSWAAPVSGRVTVLAASEDPQAFLGEFRCLPSDAAWREENHIGGDHHVVFPGTSVGIVLPRAEPLTTDANQVVLYNPGQTYRRRLVDPRGDRCLFVAVGPEYLAALAGRAGSPVDAGLRFGTVARASSVRAFLSVRALRDRLVRGDLDRLEAADAMLRLVDAAVLGDGRAAPRDRPARADTDRQHRALVADARAVLAARYREDLSLGELAREVAVSPYHLHRVFRARTGWTVHDYRDQLRLREGMDAVRDGAEDLGALAQWLGYANHSHFTARFRRLFGVTPTQVRDGALAR